MSFHDVILGRKQYKKCKTTVERRLQLTRIVHSDGKDYLCTKNLQCGRLSSCERCNGVNLSHSVSSAADQTEMSSYDIILGRKCKRKGYTKYANAEKCLRLARMSQSEGRDYLCTGNLQSGHLSSCERCSGVNLSQAVGSATNQTAMSSYDIILGRCSPKQCTKRETKAQKCLCLTRIFHSGETDHFCTTDPAIAEVWAFEYYLYKMQWVNGLITWHFTRSAQ